MFRRRQWRERERALSIHIYFYVSNTLWDIQDIQQKVQQGPKMCQTPILSFCFVLQLQHLASYLQYSTALFTLSVQPIIIGYYYLLPSLIQYTVIQIVIQIAIRANHLVLCIYVQYNKMSSQMEQTYIYLYLYVIYI